MKSSIKQRTVELSSKSKTRLRRWRVWALLTAKSKKWPKPSRYWFPPPQKNIPSSLHAFSGDPQWQNQKIQLSNNVLSNQLISLRADKGNRFLNRHRLAVKATLLTLIVEPITHLYDFARLPQALVPIIRINSNSTAFALRDWIYIKIYAQLQA